MPHPSVRHKGSARGVSALPGVAFPHGSTAALAAAFVLALGAGRVQAADKPAAKPAAPAAAASGPCAGKPEVRFYHWAWNAQMGLILANGGKQATPDSAMCKQGVNLKLIREDNTDQMQALMVAFAEGLKHGEANPAKGAHFVAIMGDGAAVFLKGLNDRLRKLGPEYTAAVVGGLGFSRGEDKFMGPQAWKDAPEKAKGGLVAGVLRDGDWNIAMKWLGDHSIANNPDDKVYDPNALNWVNASDYIDAAQKYVSGYCTELKNVKTGKKEKHCVDGVVTWTPGDVTVAEKRGGIVSILSTKENRTQMPCVIIGNRKWMSANAATVTGMLRAAMEGGDIVTRDQAALQHAAELSAVVYGEKDAAYWMKYFKPVTVKDKKGMTVELGGSLPIGLVGNLMLFGFTGTDYFGTTYTTFGNIVKAQYPELLPSFDPPSAITDLTYLKTLQEEAKKLPQK